MALYYCRALNNTTNSLSLIDFQIKAGILLRESVQYVEGCLAYLKKTELVHSTVCPGPSVASSNPALPQDAFSCLWRPCGVTWDAVPEQSWLLKLRATVRTRCNAGLEADRNERTLSQGQVVSVKELVFTISN